MLQRYVPDVSDVCVSVSYGCCKSRSGCCKSVPNVLSVFFPDVCCKCVYLDIAYVSHICCSCFIWMLHTLAMAFKCFQVFCKFFGCMLKCFYLLQTYVASVSSGPCKNRSDVALVAMCTRSKWGANDPRARSSGLGDAPAARAVWTREGAVWFKPWPRELHPSTCIRPHASKNQRMGCMPVPGRFARA